MIDHEQVMETLKNDLLAAGLDPVKHLPIEGSGHHLGRRCKECVHIYRKKRSDGTCFKWKGCKPRGWNSMLTGGEFACGKFKEKEE